MRTYRRPLLIRLADKYSQDVFDILGCVVACAVLGACIIAFMAAIGNHGAVDAVRVVMQ